jgi:hypothetical protein
MHPRRKFPEPKAARSKPRPPYTVESKRIYNVRKFHKKRDRHNMM